MNIAHSSDSVSVFHCQICGKTFGKRSILTMHMSIHQTPDDNKQRFDAMERRSSRTKTRILQQQSNSPVTSAAPQKQTDSPVIIKYRTRSKDKLSSPTGLQTRSSSGDNNSRKKAKLVSSPSDNSKKRTHPPPPTPPPLVKRVTANYRTRSTSKANARGRRVTSSRDASPALEQRGRPEQCGGDSSTTSVDCVDNLVTTESCDVTSSPNSALTTSAASELNANPDSDKENNEIAESLKQNLDIPDSVLEQFLLPGLSTDDASSSSSSKRVTRPNSLDIVKTTAPSIGQSDIAEPVNNNSSVSKKISVISANNCKQVSEPVANTVPARSLHAANSSANDVKLQTTEKRTSNTQTIVIVIREAKPIRRASIDDIDSKNNNNSIKALASVPHSAAKTIAYSNTQLHRQNQNQQQGVNKEKVPVGKAMAMTQQPQMLSSSTGHQFQAAKPLQVLQTTGGSTSSSSKLYSLAMSQVLGPTTATVLGGRCDVPRSVASIAPSFVSTSAANKSAVGGGGSDVMRNNNNVLENNSGSNNNQRVTAALNNNIKLEMDGDTTESDTEGHDDYPPTRKSARLDGKVPAWKRVEGGGSMGARGAVESLPDTRRRKVGKARVDHQHHYHHQQHQQNHQSMDQHSDLSDVAAELLTGVVEDVEIDDDELVDMSNQLFGAAGARRQRMFRDEHSCEICGKSFSTEKYLQMHSSLHGAATPARHLVAENYKTNEYRELDGFKSSWTCKICNKAFAQNSSFKNHMRTHSDERPFVCDICSIGFKERYHLKKHMLFKHSDELKEKCQFCGKRFKDSTAVRAHERIHSDHRPYHCRRCGKAFKTSECLWHHENRSKTCGALGGPPLPPLPKKARVSRKSKNSVAIMQQNAPVHVMHSQHVPISAQQQQQQHVLPVAKTEQESMLELVQQIIQSDHNKRLAARPQQQLHQHNNNSTANGLPATTSYVNTNNSMATQMRFAQTTQQTSPPSTASLMQSATGMAAMTSQHGLTAAASQQHNGMTSRSPAMSATVQSSASSSSSSAQPPTSTAPLTHHTVKIEQAQGQQLVFSLPVIKDGNQDAAAQVTKAILDAITNSTGQMKGVNIQKTIQCAVNNVQEVFDVTSGGGGGAPAVSSQQQQQQQAGAQQSMLTIPLISSTGGALPMGVPAQGLHAVTSSSSMTSQAVLQQGGGGAGSTKPYTVSILPPISSVAHALRTRADDVMTAGSTESDDEEEYYSSEDSDDMEGVGDEETEEEEEAGSTTVPSLTAVEGVMTASSSRPIATVQPLRRVDTRRSSSTDSDTASSPPLSHHRQPYSMQQQQQQTTARVARQSNYNCTKCGKGFAVLSAYEKHLLKHNEVRPFRCLACDIGFKLKVHLKKHNLYRHSDEYPCECSICGKRFKDSSAVRLHERIHSEERPFQCGCGKSFKTKENLWGHQNRKMCPYAGCSPTATVAAPQGGGVNVVMTSQYLANTQNNLSSVVSGLSNSSGFTSVNGGAAIRITSQPIKQENQAGFSSCSNGNQLPSIDSFAHAYSPAQRAADTEALQAFIKKESIAEQCPTIQNLLKKGPPSGRGVTKLPGIQQLFKQHHQPQHQQQGGQGNKPPPPYPGHVTPPRYGADTCMSPVYSYQSSSASPIPSPLQHQQQQHSVPSSPVRSPYSRQSSQSPIIASPGGSSDGGGGTPSLNMMLNADHLFSPALKQDAFWRSSNPSSRKGSELASPGEYCTVAMTMPPKSPRSSNAMSPAPSQCSEGGAMSHMLWGDEDVERKAVLTQWQNTDSDTLFMELSTNMLSQI